MAGINLTDTTNDPGITLVHNSTEAPGNFDNWNYIVDVSEYGAQFDEGGNVLVDEDGKIAFAPGTDFNQTITITGDWNNLDGGDGWPGAPNGGDYVAAQFPTRAAVFTSATSTSISWTGSLPGPSRLAISGTMPVRTMTSILSVNMATKRATSTC